MPVPERPQLRPYLTAAPEDGDNRCFLVWDQLRVAEHCLRLTALELKCLPLFDGRRTLQDVQAEALRWSGGQLVPLERFSRLATLLDDALFLEGPRFRERVNDPVRQPVCVAGCEAGALRRQLDGLFTAPGGAGLPVESRPDGGFWGALVPHIDYGRGGLSYTWAFKEVHERTPASLFVIVGTSHYSRHRFTLTRKHFRTPLGMTPTDQRYVERLAELYGDGLFDDELMAHLPEHSIELEVVFLQHLFEGKRPIRIVPLVVGSFHDCVEGGRPPAQQPDVVRMIEALRRLERETPEPICYLISGDLAHLGPKFGDPEPVAGPLLAHSRLQDQALLRRAEQADPAGYFQVIAGEGDDRRICGLPPTYTLLEALRPRHGRLLHYDQYVHPQGHESVSFASMAFYR